MKIPENAAAHGMTFVRGAPIRFVEVSGLDVDQAGVVVDGIVYITPGKGKNPRPDSPETAEFSRIAVAALKGGLITRQ